MEYFEINADDYFEITDFELSGKGLKVISPNRSIKYFFNSLLHRTDGPAIIYENNMKCWYLDGYAYHKEEWFKLLTQEQLAIALANTENF